MLTRSDYKYKLHHDNVISIIDLNLGRMSVTNDIENVVGAIAEQNGITNIDKWLVVYRDSEGTWDGWIPLRENFVPLNCETEEAAIQKIT